MWRYLSLLVSVVTIACLFSCTDIQYGWQATTGHLKILSKALPIHEVLQEATLSPALRVQLEAANDIRSFSIHTLNLPNNASYTKYVDLQQPYVVWNVFAAPKLSLDLYRWCFPVTGCLSYKGFYDHNEAKDLGQNMTQQGFDVSVSGVPAYSTLGWTDDPLLSTFIYYPRGELARMIFHELAHQVVYIQDDTAFNESFATAVEELGVELWLSKQQDQKIDKEYRQFDRRRKQFKWMLFNTKMKLKNLYECDLTAENKLEEKNKIFQDLMNHYETVKQTEWDSWKGYDRFFADHLNNAKLAGVGLYDEYVPEFKVLFEASGSRFDRFYDEVKRLGQLSQVEREEKFKKLRYLNRSM